MRSHIKGILADFPEVDTVFIDAGIQNHYMIFQPPKNAVSEVIRNVIAPNLIAQSLSHIFSPWSGLA